ncbi:MAG: hypothetical protein WCG87_08890 [Bacteroidota bacterium]
MTNTFVKRFFSNILLIMALFPAVSFGQDYVFPFDLENSFRSSTEVASAQKMFAENCKIASKSCCADDEIDIKDLSLEVDAKDLQYLMSTIHAEGKDCKALYVYYGLDKCNNLVFIFNPARFQYADVDNFNVSFSPHENLNYYVYRPNGMCCRGGAGCKKSEEKSCSKCPAMKWENISGSAFSYKVRYKRRLRVKDDNGEFKKLNVNYAEKMSDPAGVFFVNNQIEELTQDGVEKVTFSFGLDNYPMNANLDDRFVHSVILSNKDKGTGALNGAVCPPGFPQFEVVKVKMALVSQN